MGVIDSKGEDSEDGGWVSISGEMRV
ncbi:uncharacterized protein G2W53_025241 [Senna tora]|uniref:Uncharacterized protein n=1 Tax=Senna tora TaxID=362788 RepID=A0A834WHP9_9FABA|nr:uncharacterized protein G2W53_025241 [Senna tora]